eukprot:2136757-Amphidinium_carterae.1
MTHRSCREGAIMASVRTIVDGCLPSAHHGGVPCMGNISGQSTRRLLRDDVSCSLVLSPEAL